MLPVAIPPGAMKPSSRACFAVKFSTVTPPFGRRSVMLKSLKKYVVLFSLRIVTAAQRLVKPNLSAVRDHLALTTVWSTKAVSLLNATQSVGLDPGYALKCDAQPEACVSRLETAAVAIGDVTVPTSVIPTTRSAATAPRRSTADGIRDPGKSDIGGTI